ncbi:cytidylyltransferase domain-containing protein [Cyanobium sp. ATX 6F1]|uniref:acylneuraminate cytidylyltransferase family protein n=1 Tax=unclassified Cyanobium TaxID=2627006 RepID=UPI0020CDD4A5|nr:acylneuraminate cytidylyltransferase family protein [Cyanobium sp. ATX 6F1]MCP9916800.1 acylneuraminate cytidylyltransferase family protein [Cyanobium sp. ATX 6F1]
MTRLALIPARSGSSRLQDKNVAQLGGHPLMAYSIATALESGCFDTVHVVTDSENYADIARSYGARVPGLRPESTARSDSPDISWVRWFFESGFVDGPIEYFSILRPTSPFRQADTIRRAFAVLQENHRADSVRAVEKTSLHPGKMWRMNGPFLTPLLPFDQVGTPWHSSQMAALPTVYVQNASLEIARYSCFAETGSIAGHLVAPFLTTEMEGFDINYPLDLEIACRRIESGEWILPEIGSPAAGST